MQCDGAENLVTVTDRRLEVTLVIRPNLTDSRIIAQKGPPLKPEKDRSGRAGERGSQLGNVPHPFVDRLGRVRMAVLQQTSTDS